MFDFTPRKGECGQSSMKWPRSALWSKIIIIIIMIIIIIIIIIIVMIIIAAHRVCVGGGWFQRVTQRE